MKPIQTTCETAETAVVFSSDSSPVLIPLRRPMLLRRKKYWQEVAASSYKKEKKKHQSYPEYLPGIPIVHRGEFSILECIWVPDGKEVKLRAYPPLPNAVRSYVYAAFSTDAHPSRRTKSPTRLHLPLVEEPHL